MFKQLALLVVLFAVANADCVDGEPGCAGLLVHCSDPNIAAYCPKTCKVCTPSTQPPPTCEDGEPNCKTIWQQCSDPNVAAYCPRTCNACYLVSTTASTSCEDTYTNCNSYLSYCSNNQGVRQHCPKTCGLC